MYTQVQRWKDPIFQIAAATLFVTASSIAVAESARIPVRGAPSGVRSDGSELTTLNDRAWALATGVDIALGGNNEVTIVVNPIEPLNLAMSSLHQYRISNDSGVSWGPALLSVAPSGYSRSGDPSLAFDSQGRLFYAHLGTRTSGSGVDVFVYELDSASGDVLTLPVRVTNAGPFTLNDKPWLAADPFPASPFRDRLYAVWTRFEGDRTVFGSYSADHGMTWSTPIPLSDAADFLPWPAHVAAAPNGDVYVSYHAQTGFLCNTDGISGKVYVARSTDGGATFPQKTLAFGPGQADITFNIQDCPDGVIPGTDFWMQGSIQAWLLPDPVEASVISVVASDDPDDAHGSGDDANVYIARSGDYGLTWADPRRVDHDPGASLQAFPTAAIDHSTGCIAVMWYDTRNGAVNANGNYLLDVFYSISTDGGFSFGPDVQLNDVPFDPDKNAPVKDVGPPPTRRIGEYIGAAIGASVFHGVWTGNNIGSQQAITDSAAVDCEPPPPPPSIVWNSDPLSPERTTRSLRFRLQSPVVVAQPRSVGAHSAQPGAAGLHRRQTVREADPNPALAPQVTATASPEQSAIKVTMIALQHPVPPNLPANPPPDFSGYEAGSCAPMACVGGPRNALICTVPADCPGPGVCTEVAESSGCARWVGKPGTFFESQDNHAIGEYRAARLQCTPYYADWVAETASSSIAVVGGEIIPSSEYSVQAYGASCKGTEAGCVNVSSAVTMYTRRYGDVEAPFNPPMTSTQPDVADIAQAINRFKNIAGAPPKAIVQLQPNLPELNADVGALDIVACVDAVKQKAYAFSGPCPCPSTVMCGSTSCSNPTPCVAAFGAGAMCVKTCIGGANAGDPCINDTHCPGSTCGAGYCRDRCGRCSP